MAGGTSAADSRHNSMCRLRVVAGTAGLGWAKESSMGARASWRQSWCIVLDVDTALLEPGNLASEATIDDELVDVLRHVGDAVGGALALISARPILLLDDLFAPLRLAAIGVGGLERRTADGRFAEGPVDWLPLATARRELRTWADERPALSVEDREVALVLRWDDEAALGAAVRRRVGDLVARMGPDFEMHKGAMCVEVRPRVCDHADAIEALLATPPFAGRVPLYVGDESSDAETSQAIERRGGWTIGVGSQSTLPLRLAGRPAVRRWLGRLTGPAGLLASGRERGIATLERPG